MAKRSEAMRSLNEISFTIPGRPIPAARMTRRGKWVKRQAQKYLAFKEQVGWEARKHFKGEPWQGPVGVELRFYLKVIRSVGDGDNYLKAVLDGMNGIVYEDDGQVKEGHYYILDGEPQRTEVRVWKLNGSSQA
jgi:Holliday junction resolvase RusA-like endonuclease